MYQIPTVFMLTQLSECAPRYQVKLDIYKRKFLFSSFPSNESAKRAALAYVKVANEMIEAFDSFKGKAQLVKFFSSILSHHAFADHVEVLF